MRIDVTLSSTPENYPRDLCGEHCVSLYPPWISSTKGFKDRFIIVEVEEDRAAILLQPSLRWRGILKPYSVPMCGIQDMCLADIYKGREAFCELRPETVLRCSLTEHLNGTLRPILASQIHAQSVALTPFRTVS